MNKAQRDLQQGSLRPYDAPDAWWQAPGVRPALAPVDWAHTAARGILYDLSDRAGIKHAFHHVDESVRADIVRDLADIIRESAASLQQQVTAARAWYAEEYPFEDGVDQVCPWDHA